MIGRKVAQYSIVEELGAGEMGVVYKAIDTRLHRTVALKFLPPEYSRDETQRERLLREATAASALDHPNICTIYEIAETDDRQLFISMPFYSGETLKRVIERGPLPLDQAIDYCTQVAQGLVRAHSREIVHRDIKPANIILTSDGIVKIIDFGLARVSQDPDATLTTPNAGTPAYMSPEQVIGSSVDARSDIWALGVVLYEALTGHRPFGSPYAIVNEPAAPLSDGRPGIPQWLELVVHKALEKGSEDRYHQAAELLADLKSRSAGWFAEASATTLRPQGTTGFTSSATTLASGTSVSRLVSIAVLPFENVSSDKENEYFSDGLTEELINALAQLRGIRVVARTSVFEFKGKAQSVRRIGEQFRVGSVLEGTVQRAGTRVRITVRLVNVADGFPIWSQRYDRQMSDVFEVQDEIARTIVEGLKVELRADEQGPLVRRATENPEAYRFYLEGRFHWHKRSPEALQKAFAAFNAALELDDRFASAYSGLADCYLMLASYGLAPGEDAWPKAKNAAMKALELDPTLANAHMSLGYVLMFYEWRWQDADRELLLALEYNPNSFETRVGRTFYLMATARLDEALVQVKRAKDLDPLSAFVSTYEAMVLVYLGNYDRSIDVSSKALGIEPNSIELHYALGLAYQQKALFDKAIPVFEKGCALSGNSPIMLGWLGAAHALAGNRDAALRIREQLAEKAKSGFAAALPCAILYIGLGDLDAAFEWLNKSADARETLLCYIKATPTYDPIRHDPRYAQLLSRMGLA